MGLIYKITNQINNKVYIGKTVRAFEERKKEHLRDYKKEDNKIYRAMRKYGIDNFIFEIIESDIENTLLDEKERFYIKQYNSYYNGYNATFGGEGESPVDEEQIIELYKKGYNCKDINKITHHTTKTISSVLKRNEVEITRQRPSKLSKNKREVPVLYNGIKYDSLSKLAEYLILNVDFFKDKRKATIIQGISRSIKEGHSYYGYKFYSI